MDPYRKKKTGENERQDAGLKKNFVGNLNWCQEVQKTTVDRKWLMMIP